MAQYTFLDQQAIEKILTEYSIEDLQSFKVLSGGSQNTNYLANTKKGKFVLSICEQKTAQKAEELAQLLAHLEQNGFQSSKIIWATTGKAITIREGKPIMIKKYIEGKIIEDLPNHLIELIGKELGKLHKIKAPDYVPKKLAYGIEHFYKVEKYAANSAFNTWLKDIQKYISPYLQLDLPKALIHSDVFL